MYPWTWCSNAKLIYPIHQALIQYKYKQGIMQNGRLSEIGKDLISALRGAGFIPRSYGICDWSSDYHGWWVFEIDDLEKFRGIIRRLRRENVLDEWLDLRITIGTCYPTVPFSVEPVNWRASSPEIAVRTAGAFDGERTRFHFEVISGPGTLSEKPLREEPEPIVTKELDVTAVDGEVTVYLRNPDDETRVLISVDVPLGEVWPMRGILVSKDQEEEQAP